MSHTAPDDVPATYGDPGQKPNEMCQRCDNEVVWDDSIYCYGCWHIEHKVCEFCGDDIEGMPQDDDPMTCVECHERGVADE